MSPNDADGIANSVDPDRCLPRHICPKTWDHYGMSHLFLQTAGPESTESWYGDYLMTEETTSKVTAYTTL